MNIKVMRQVKFCAGHRLVGHEGKCANPHGHNYVVEFHVCSSEVDSVGRIVDFSILNQLFKSWIDEHWDHGFLVWEADRALAAALEQIKPNKVYYLPFNPTAENLARYLLTEIGPQLLSRVDGYELELIKVVVWETENAHAEASLGAPSSDLTFDREGVQHTTD